MAVAADAVIGGYLKALRLAGLAHGYEQVIRDAEENNLGYRDFLRACLEHEMAWKEQSRVRRLIAQARFPVVKTVDSFDFSVQPDLPSHKILGLMNAGFVGARESVILVGKPGTGKTHLAIALGVAACQAGHRVRFYTAANLANQLVEARANHSLSRFERLWRKTHLVILDELGYVPFSREAGQLLFAMISSRYELGSFVVTSNLDFSRWTEIFGDEGMTAALIDRLVHRGHIFTTTGDSYRFRESLRRSRENTT
jgi:DNA replication protein DnaC